MMHIVFHFIVPAVLVFIFFRKDWKKAYLFMVLTMLVDLDHLLASPVYDSGRCSIGFHPMHQIIPILFYLLACMIPKLRYVGIGLVIHMLLDSLDCQFTNNIWFVSL